MMSLNTGWVQQRTDQTLGGTIVIKTEDQRHLGPTIVIKPDDQHVYLQTGDSSLIKLQTANTVLGSKCSMFTQTEPTNRCTQTDGNINNAIEAGRQDGTIAMFDQSGQPQVYIASNPEKKDDKTEFPLCYNVSMLQKLPLTSGLIGPLHATTGTAVGTAIMDEKGCYRLDVGQSFSYNYVVNPTVVSATAYKCDVCDMAFSHPTLLTQHKRVHNEEEEDDDCESEGQHIVQVDVQEQPLNKDYACEPCGIHFALPGELKSHQNSHHKGSMMRSTKVVLTKNCELCGAEIIVNHVPGGKKRQYICESCAESEKVMPLEAPNTKPYHHPVKKRGIPCVTKCQACNGSGLIFVGSSKAKKAPTASKPFHCNICDGTFSRYSSLWSHRRLHSGDKPYSCKICGQSFAKTAYLKNHERVHTGEKPFRCGTCGMQFSQSPHLKNHERIHSGERPYECEVCSKTFARHSTLWNHRRIHTGEKPYRCNVCDAKFNQATHLKNHIKVHTGEKPHKCDTCEASFADRFALKRHQSVHEKYARAANQNRESVAGEPITQLTELF